MSDLSRRQFLGAAGAAVVASGAGATASTARSRGPLTGEPLAKNVIFLHLVGGPSQLDTFDPKPDAPSTHRSPFGTIPTRIPGVHVTELFPKLAGIADKVAFVRTLHHTAPPIHEAGFQLLHTGRLFRDGPVWPSVGSVVSFLHGDTKMWGFPPRHYVSPSDQVNTGATISHGFGPGYLGERSPYFVPYFGGGVGCPDEFIYKHVRDNKLFDADTRYGDTVFGFNCFGAVGTVALGSGRFITVLDHQTVFDSPSWDCHADGGSLACDLGDYRDTVAPSFDAAFTRLVLDLEDRGLLDETLVVAVGEFGRTPKRNSTGGRDHWPGCWTALLAGGGVRGGQVIGRSDAVAGEPADRPVTCPELVATIYHALGLHGATIPGPDGSPVPVVEAEPVREVF
jgi:hypothetical protein